MQAGQSVSKLSVAVNVGITNRDFWFGIDKEWCYHFRVELLKFQFTDSEKPKGAVTHDADKLVLL